MNSSQIHDFEDNVPIPTYAYYSKIDSSLIDSQAYKTKYTENINKACKGVTGVGSVTSQPTDLDDYGKKAWKLYTEKNPKDADKVVASILAGKKPTSLSTNTDNQIQYLACQVAKMHAREYDPDQFEQAGSFVELRVYFKSLHR